MADRIYYCVCDLGCKFETMTKEQILTAIVQAVNEGKITNIDTGFVTKLKEQNKGGYVTVWRGTTAEYNALTEKEENCIYIKIDDTRLTDIEKAIDDYIKKIKNIENKMLPVAAVLTQSVNIEGVGVQTIFDVTIDEFNFSELYNGFELTIIPNSSYNGDITLIRINSGKAVAVKRGGYYIPAGTFEEGFPYKLVYWKYSNENGVVFDDWLADNAKISNLQPDIALPVESGGTGATTIEGAREKLGIAHNDISNDFISLLEVGYGYSYCKVHKVGNLISGVIVADGDFKANTDFTRFLKIKSDYMDFSAYGQALNVIALNQNYKPIIGHSTIVNLLTNEMQYVSDVNASRYIISFTYYKNDN